MNTKICLILILSLLFISINTADIDGSTACSASKDTDVTINAGTTKDTGDWDKVVTCVKALTGNNTDPASVVKITKLTVNLKADMSANTSSTFDFKVGTFDENIEFIFVFEGSKLTPAQLKTNFFTTLKADGVKFKSITITSDVVPLLADITVIEGLLDSSKINTGSKI